MEIIVIIIFKKFIKYLFFYFNRLRNKFYLFILNINIFKIIKKKKKEKKLLF